MTQFMGEKRIFRSARIFVSKIEIHQEVKCFIYMGHIYSVTILTFPPPHTFSFLMELAEQQIWQKAGLE